MPPAKLRLRPLVQAGFLALVVVGVFVVRGHTERFCPFGGVESLWSLVTGGGLPCSLAFTNLFLLGGVLLSALLFRRAFCGYACPIGAISEWVGRGAARVGLPALRVPRRLDAVLSLAKYPALAVILWFTFRTGELVFRGFDPCYALLSRHGADITFFAYLVSGAILALSLFLSVPFCRYLCPLAAVLNPFSRAAPARIVRDAAACASCGCCAGACPMAIPVDAVAAVTHARCTACLDCVDACRPDGALAFRMTGLGQRAVPRAAVAAGSVLSLLIAVAAAALLAIPSFTWRRGEAAASGSVELTVEGLTCRGRAQLLMFYLDRDDDLALPGALRLSTWPGPESGRVTVAFDAEKTDADAVRRAITEPYFDLLNERWLPPPFAVRGFDPLGLRR